MPLLRNTADHRFAISDASAEEIPGIIETSTILGGPHLVVGTTIIDLADERLRVAKAGGRIVGWHATRRSCGEALDILAILSHERRTGVGRAMLADIEALALRAGATFIRVETTNDNLSAQSFYRACGFDLVAVRQGAFRDVLRLKGLSPDLKVTGEGGRRICDVLRFQREVDRTNGHRWQ